MFIIYVCTYIYTHTRNVGDRYRELWYSGSVVFGGRRREGREPKNEEPSHRHMRVHIYLWVSFSIWTKIPLLSFVAYLESVFNF
ncbi:LOW QUALITY PROTEIN: hypothetical protein PanWU01x14_033910 [Parasponia andersonii]|uniref:Transmembrane protein n=1 Tax=Parasponia andersonii TaxID=3476 RepID=A0A2P5DTU0_PARAD|nr:LOW QUALITY PROTEIN: hypothetical protein PanWU01x14_033910 [Parasponia andersonii]